MDKMKPEEPDYGKGRYTKYRKVKPKIKDSPHFFFTGEFGKRSFS